jgi:hypothetical protein
MNKILSSVWKALLTPGARRGEYLVAIAVYEGVKAALGHP